MSASGLACSLLCGAAVMAAAVPGDGHPDVTPAVAPSHFLSSYAAMTTANGQSVVARRPSATTERAPPAVAFDIPAQPLDEALEAYAAATGQSVIYDSHLTERRTSRAVRGTLTPMQALDAMLEGSGLKVRYTSAKALVLVRADDAAPVATQDDARALQRYRGLLQAKVTDAFCADARLAAGDRRLALRLWIDADGSIERAQLLDSTGDGDFDAAVVQRLQGISLGQALPAGAAQPFIMLIMPRSSGQGWSCPRPHARAMRGGSLP